jgi:hypothetical protein
MSTLKDAVEQINNVGPFGQLAVSIGFTAAIRELGEAGPLSAEILRLVNRAEELSIEFAEALPQELFG